ncbi:MAG TPA: sulfotransferase [Rhodanobacteraceae bacterium]|nr:sulfotransferase [Rhodanobacteraceae bacterium]
MKAPRLQGLDNDAAQRVIATARALELGRAAQALEQLVPTLAAYPDHPEVLRLHAGILSLRGDHAGAIDAMQRAAAARPLDPLYHNTLGTVLGASGDFDGAIGALTRACELQPGLALAWYNLGVIQTRCVRNDEAIESLRRVVQLAPDHMDARALLGDLLRMRGDEDASASEYRMVLARRPATGMAWWGLADLRNGSLQEQDIEKMRAALRDSHATDDDRIATGFALAMALDEQGRYPESLDELKRANAIARLRQKWNAQGFSAAIDAVNHAFTPPPAGTPLPDLGGAAIFIVGMPRSGTTLVEQILASHPQVEGAGELPDLSLVLAEESRRRGVPFPRWVAAMQPEDWQRLGERYLARTSHWRRVKPMFTDKLPGNWIYIGAIRAMLPGAHVIVSRRDPLETCFSCYRQLLPDGNEFSRTPEDLAAFWRDFDGSVRQSASLHPAHVYQHGHEALLADPGSSIRKLLAACGLPFEEACLHFHASQREVRSPSATQVRRPLQKDTRHASHYGNLLDPLRISLGMPVPGA